MIKISPESEAGKLIATKGTSVIFGSEIYAIDPGGGDTIPEELTKVLTPATNRVGRRESLPGELPVDFSGFIPMSPLEGLPGELPVDFPACRILFDAGLTTVEAVQAASDETLSALKGIGASTLTAIRSYGA